MPFRISGKPQTRFRNRAFLTDASEHVGERPALGRVIGDVVDGDERSANAFAEFGQKRKPARLVATMIMRAGEIGAAGRGCGEGGETRGEIITPLVLAKAGTQFWIPACAGMSGKQRKRRQRDEDLAFAYA